MKRLNIVITLLMVVMSFLSPVHASDSFTKGKTFNDGFMPFYIDDTSAQVFVEIIDFEQQFLFQSSLPHGIGSNDIG